MLCATPNPLICILKNYKMEKLTNEEIARVFAMYWGCPVEFSRMITGGGFKRVVENINLNYGIGQLMQRGPKLLLTPLDKISDEDATEVEIIYFGEGQRQMDKQYIAKKTIERLYSYDYSNQHKRPIEHLEKAIYVHQFLISKRYSVPLFFGSTHWANGKTALELNIAIETPNPPPSVAKG